jgi:hypothetical protein
MPAHSAALLAAATPLRVTLSYFFSRGSRPIR